jgi:DNA primase small subunit
MSTESSSSGVSISSEGNYETGKAAARYPRNAERMEYYAHLPLRAVFQFANLNREREDDFVNRELSFCFSEPGGSVCWSRFRSFDSAAAFKDYVRRAQPLSINIGALGFSPSSLWKTDNTRTDYYESEVMLDVDIKDYDDVRTCNCSGSRMTDHDCPECGKPKGNEMNNGYEEICTCEWERFSNNICLQCWKFAQCGMITLDYILRKHWGVTDFFFVFSGMKGFHCWIMDETFRGFDEDQRWDFACSFDPWTDEHQRTLKSEKTFRDPLYGKDFDEFLLVLFTEIIVGEGVFDVRHVNTRLKIIEFFEIRNMKSEATFRALTAICDDAIDKCHDSKRSWKDLMDFNFRTNDQITAKTIQRRFVYAYVYPRIDRNVTTQLGHLRKLPWSPHLTSECIALPILPISPERIFEFTPKMAPTMRDLDVVDTTSEQFAVALDLMSIRLDDVLYCDELFPTFPRMDELLQLGDAGKIFRQLDGWMQRNVLRESLFYEPYPYEVHGRQCGSCNPLIALDRHNTLLKLIVRKSWVGGVYRGVLEECMKLSLIQICETFGFLPLPEALWHRIGYLQRER